MFSSYFLGNGAMTRTRARWLLLPLPWKLIPNITDLYELPTDCQDSNTKMPIFNVVSEQYNVSHCKWCTYNKHFIFTNECFSNSDVH